MMACSCEKPTEMSVLNNSCKATAATNIGVDGSLKSGTPRLYRNPLASGAIYRRRPCASRRPRACRDNNIAFGVEDDQQFDVFVACVVITDAGNPTRMPVVVGEDRHELWVEAVR